MPVTARPSKDIDLDRRSCRSRRTARLEEGDPVETLPLLWPRTPTSWSSAAEASRASAPSEASASESPIRHPARCSSSGLRRTREQPPACRRRPRGDRRRRAAAPPLAARSGRRGLGHRHGGRARAARLVCRAKPASRRRRCRRDRSRRHGGLPGARGVPGRRGRRADARGRERSRGFGGRPCAKGAQRHWSGAHHVSLTAGCGDRIEEVPVEALSVGDHVLVRQGEVVPVDGLVMSGEAVLDESALSGEALPVSYKQGAPVRSGTANAGDAFELRATRPASESAYAAVVRLVRQAESHKAPFVRMADRYAAFFLPVTLSRPGRVGAERRSGSRAGGARRRDTLPLDPGRARRDSFGSLARRTRRRHRQGRRTRSNNSERHAR